MAREILNLAEVVSMTQVFRVELNRWPVNAAELLVFSLSWGKPLNFSNLHTLVFVPEDRWNFTMEYTLFGEGKPLASCGRIELRRIGQTDQEMLFAWQTRHRALPPRPIKGSIYCLIP